MTWPCRALAFALTLVCVGSCGGEDPLRRVSFHVRFGGVARDVSQPLVVTTPLGWTVTLTAARVSLGPLYFRNGEPGVGTDEDDGRVVAEVLARFTVDALNPDLGSIEGAGRGVTESARAGEVRLTEADDGPIAAEAGAGVAVARIEGVAERGGVVIRFAGNVALTQSAAVSAYAVALQHRVAHIATNFLPADGGTLTLRVDPSHWLDALAFDTGGVAPDFSSRSTITQVLSGLGSARGVYMFEWSGAR